VDSAWLVSFWNRNPRRNPRNLVCARSGEEACLKFAIVHGLERDARGIHARHVPEEELESWRADGWPCVEWLIS